MLRRISPEAKAEHLVTPSLSLPNLKEAPRQRPLVAVLTLSALAVNIQKPSVLTFREIPLASIVRIPTKSVHAESDSKYIARDRRCADCHHRHSPRMRCGTNMLLQPQSFRPRKFNRELSLKSSGS